MAAWIWATDANAGPPGWLSRANGERFYFWSYYLAPVLPYGEMASLAINSIPDMVNQVLAAAGTDKIERLIIYGHAESGMQAVGCGTNFDTTRSDCDFLKLTPGTGILRNGAEAELARLKPQLAPDARVSLGGCEVAAPPDGESLLKRISTVLGGVTVEGGLWLQTSLWPGYEGPVVRCTANSCTTMRGPFKELR